MVILESTVACLKACYRVWESLQVELHGQYSLSRFEGLVKFSKETSAWRALGICLLSASGCIAVIVLVDLMPLRPPSDGVWHQSYSYWLRTFFTDALFTGAVLIQFHFSSPGLTLSTRTLFLSTTVVGLSSTLVTLGLHVLVGFPTPFLFQMIGMPWSILMFSTMAILWKRAILASAEVRLSFIQYVWFFVSQFGMMASYPIMVYTFSCLTRPLQTIFSMVFPILKILFKNWSSYGALRLEDLAPVYVVFSVDVFHALLLSCAMQSATSSGTFFVAICVDVFQSIVPVSEVFGILRTLRQLRLGIASQPNYQGPRDVGVFSFSHWILASRPDVRTHPDIAFAASTSLVSDVIVCSHYGAKQLPTAKSDRPGFSSHTKVAFGAVDNQRRSL